MPPGDRDAAWLWDMLDSARTVRRIVAGTRFSDYAADRIRQMAVERGIELIGEAARRVSETFKQAHPEIPWRGIIAQRNMLAHEYGEIKQDRLWIIATERVPELIAALEPLVPSPPPAE